MTAGGEMIAPLRAATGQKRKALVEFDGKASMVYTIQAIREAGIKDIAVVSGVDVFEAISGTVNVEEGDNAIENAMRGANALQEKDGILFLPSDSPLIRAEHISDFLTFVADSRPSVGEWFATGLTPTNHYRARFPGAPYKSIKLREGEFLAGSLYAASPHGVTLALNKLQGIRHSRKSQFSMLLKLGLGNLIRYALGNVDRQRAETVITKFLGGQTFIKLDCDPATCMDFDDVADYHYLRQVMSEPT